MSDRDIAVIAALLHNPAPEQYGEGGISQLSLANNPLGLGTIGEGARYGGEVIKTIPNPNPKPNPNSNPNLNFHPNANAFLMPTLKL